VAAVKERQTVGLGDQIGPADSPPGARGRSCILTVNGGSSSLKFALFHGDDPLERRAWGRIERIGLPGARLVATGAGGISREVEVNAPDQRAAAGVLKEWVQQEVGLTSLAAVGHRVVHGGGRYHRPERVTDELIADLRRIGPFDPEHLPGELDLIESFRRLDPSLTQIACFDTAFHHELPRVAQIVPIPRRFEKTGVRRYGFHGLSYAFLTEELNRVAGPHQASGRIVLAHLGSGSSLAAVRDGHPVETTMGFTPASGLVMGTRSGDLDPGLVRFLMTAEGLSVEAFHAMVNHESGLLGISETSPDLRDLLRRQREDVRAAEAVELYCYRIRTAIGALAAALGGLDTLVFAGGIGENAPEIRRRVCDGLAFLGISVDGHRNDACAAVISADDAPVTVRVIRTDEEVMIARATSRLLCAEPARATEEPR
jgi:acetate kinase